jgi:hypothetical protein
MHEGFCGKHALRGLQIYWKIPRSALAGEAAGWLNFSVIRRYRVRTPFTILFEQKQ